MKILLGILMLLLFAAPAAAGPLAIAARPMPVCSYGKPAAGCIVDGDTLWVDGAKIRLEDIDAPEVEHFFCAGEKALGDRATLALQGLLDGKPFLIEQDGPRAYDVYGRELRTVYVDGASAGQLLVAGGLAHEWVGHKLPWC